uniref:Uncharacterized protein n=1 Tax=Tetranychus urticae TaxID=32264 RepID=T1KD36_TETUR
MKRKCNIQDNTKDKLTREGGSTV